MLSLPLAWTHETRLLTEARIPGLWDTSVPIISGTCTDTICLSLPQHGPGEPISVIRCDIGTGYFADKPERPGHGSRSGIGLIGQDFGEPQTEPEDQSIIQGMFLLSHLWARVLFNSIAYTCDCVC